MMINKKRYIPPYIEIVEEGDNLLDGMNISSGYDDDDSRDAKGSHFFDDDDIPSDSNWDTEEPSGWDI